MEPNDQPQPLGSISVPIIPSPETTPSVIPEFTLDALATPPSPDAVLQTLPPINVPIAPVPSAPTASLLEQVASLEKDIVLLDQKRASLEVETGVLASEQKQIEDSLAPVRKEEEELRAGLKEIEAREMSAATKLEKRKAEQERFEQEKKRRLVEILKFTIKEKIEKILSNISGKEILHQSIIDEEASLRKKIHELEIEQQRIELSAKLEVITHTRGDAELKLSEITKEKSRIETLLHETSEKEKTIEGSQHDIETKITVTHTFKEERALAEARAALEIERHDVEEMRWKTEDEAEALGLSAVDAENALREIKKQEADLVAKMKAFK
jgi:chromosome segregation ATPase